VKRGKYTFQQDELTDVSGLALLIVFVRYVYTVASDKLEEE